MKKSIVLAAFAVFAICSVSLAAGKDKKKKEKTKATTECSKPASGEAKGCCPGCKKPAATQTKTN